MSRKRFFADVILAAGTPPSRITKVVLGEEDGEVDILYSVDGQETIGIRIIASDVFEYPHGNEFFVCITTDTMNCPVLEICQNPVQGVTVSAVICRAALQLDKVFSNGTQQHPIILDEVESSVGQEVVVNSDTMDMEDFDDAAEYWPDDEGNTFMADNFTHQNRKVTSSSATKLLDRQIKRDLRISHDAGFKTSLLSGMKSDAQSSIVSISIRVDQLALSEQAIQAWDLQNDEYVVLLVRYSAGYKPFDAIIKEAARTHHVDFRIGAYNGNRVYKPTFREAAAAFSINPERSGQYNHEAGGRQGQGHTSPGETLGSGFRSLFISSSLNDFINGKFISLVKIRYDLGYSWDNANRYLKDQTFMHEAEPGVKPMSDYEVAPAPATKHLPLILSSDHLIDGEQDEISFPLIAIQFALRYLVRCTDFCLVCHNRTKETFEALKPYVCCNPLCLYQYMALGFGPSLEHELLTQPYVVDLLISFCYSSAKCERFREYPVGLNLLVPNMRLLQNSAPMAAGPVTLPSHLAVARSHSIPSFSATIDPPATVDSGKDAKQFDIKFDALRSEGLFHSGSETIRLRNGNWVSINCMGSVSHLRVQSYTHPSIKFDPSGVTPLTFPPLLLPESSSSARGWVNSIMVLYDQNFDDLTTVEKCEAIAMLLDLTPSVQDMTDYLRGGSEISLRNWKERMPPAALGLLRWIVASNRSSIVQVGSCSGQADNKMSKLPDRRRVTNMDGFIQFHFAQGAPDKEQRFHQALEAKAAVSQLPHSTIFAWHGSPLQNWHSIIREGLDFKDVSRGRSFGNGVYHSMDINTSLGYSNYHQVVKWKASALQVSQALCLNEIVNSPDEFQSKHPHLVVQHVDWIQCRYLFVRSNAPSAQDTKKNSRASNSPKRRLDCGETLMDQDPKYFPTGLQGLPVGIPRDAVLASRKLQTKALDIKTDDTKATQLQLDGGNENATAIDDETDIEDQCFLLDTDDPGTQATMEEMVSEIDDTNTCQDPLVIRPYNSSSLKRKRVESSDQNMSLDKPPLRLRYKPSPSMTNFVPGSLDQSTLPMLQEPAHATSNASRHLNRELKNILEVQKATPIHELGWYLNGDLITNIYQWIVELHSFDKDLPFVQDMMKANVTSIVCEVQFPCDYPMAPPFVRVIRPRFLPFTQGGGGHITGGGSMCMELLTNTGWSPVTSVDMILLQVRLAIQNLEPRPARLLSAMGGGAYASMDYGTHQAMEAYIRACKAHGWEIPKRFEEFREIQAVEKQQTIDTISTWGRK